MFKIFHAGSLPDRHTLLACFCMLLAATGPALADPVTVYSYYNFPPFSIDGDTGLNRLLVDSLNARFKGKHQFALMVVPRKRLDSEILVHPQFKGVVAWVSPLWFKRDSDATHQWSKPMMDDATMILSNSANKIEYESPKSLQGKVFGGITSHYYAGIDEMVARGDIVRRDVSSERSNMLKLSVGRVDAISLPRSSARYLVHHMHLEHRIYVAATPMTRYTRHMYFFGLEPALQAEINDALAEIRESAEWRASMERYQAATQ